MKILHKIFLLLLLATFMLTSCHDDDEPIDEPTEQTVIFFMPWSTNMTPYFEQNIVDFETAIKGGLLKNERFDNEPSQRDRTQTRKRSVHP